MGTPITAAVLTQPGEPLELQEVRLDDPLPNEARVRVESVGLCHSDLHYVRGALPITTPAILGHEVAGIVEEVGEHVDSVTVGDRVVATVTPSCGRCTQCLRGRPTQCQNVDHVRARPRPQYMTPNGGALTALGGVGAFAEAILVSESSLAPVESSVPAQAACLLGCAISTGVGAVIHGAGVSPEHTVAVVGCGGVGIAAIQGARLAGARRIIAIDALSRKLHLAQRLGATDVVLAGDDSDETVRELKSILPDGVDHAFEAVGSTRTAALAFECLAPAGTATILGLVPEGAQLTLAADALIYGDRAIRGAYMGANRFLSDVTTYSDHYRRGRLDLDSMVTRIVGFDEINEGLAAMSDPDTIRVVVNMNRNRP